MFLMIIEILIRFMHISFNFFKRITSDKIFSLAYINVNAFVLNVFRNIY